MSLEEIQAVLNEIARKESLGLQVNQAGKQLTVVLNRLPNNTDVDYSQVAEDMMSALLENRPEGVTGVKFYGREKGGKQAEWQESRLFDDTTSGINSGKAKPSMVSSPPTNLIQSTSNRLLEKFKLVQETISSLALVGILIVLIINSFSGQKVQTVSYEYRIEAVPDLLFDETMNELGEEGWELVFARRAQDSITDEFSYECIFKRAK
jgi:hypothetical protein